MDDAAMLFKDSEDVLWLLLRCIMALGKMTLVELEARLHVFPILIILCLGTGLFFEDVFKATLSLHRWASAAQSRNLVHPDQ